MNSLSAIANSSKREHAYSIFLGKLVLILRVFFVFRPQRQHISVRNLNIPMFISDWKAKFFPCVSHIVQTCTQKQMLWPNTWGIITMMKDTFSLWNSAIGQNPTCTMRLDESRGIVSLSDYSVPVFICSTNPQPTHSGLFNLAPKSLWKSFRQSLRSKILACNFNHVSLVCAVRVTGPTALLFSPTPL